MNKATPLLLKANLKQLKLPTMLAEHDKLAREAASRDEPYEEYLLRLTELEVTTRSTNATVARIRAAGFPVLKDFDTFDFTATPNLPKQKMLELARGDWIGNRPRDGKQDRLRKGKHRSTALRVAMMPPQGGQGCSRWTSLPASVSCVATD